MPYFKIQALTEGENVKPCSEYEVFFTSDGHTAALLSGASGKIPTVIMMGMPPEKISIFPAERYKKAGEIFQSLD